MNERIFIPCNVISSKNSKNIFRNRKTGSVFISSSSQTKKYISETELDWVTNRNIFLELIADMEKPLKIEINNFIKI